MRCDNYVVEGPLTSDSKRLTEELAWDLHKLGQKVRDDYIQSFYEAVAHKCLVKRN